MNKSKIGVLVVAAVFAAALIFIPVVKPAPVVASLQADAPPLDLAGALIFAVQFIMGSVVIASAATYIVNTIKQIAPWLIPDDSALTWVSGLNFVLIVGVFLAKLYLPDFDPKVLETFAQTLLDKGPGFLVVVMPFLVYLSKLIYGWIRGTALIGTSYSLQPKKLTPASKRA